MGVQRSRGSVVNVRDKVEDDETLAGNQSHQVITNILSYEEERDRLLVLLPNAFAVRLLHL